MPKKLVKMNQPTTNASQGGSNTERGEKPAGTVYRGGGARNGGRNRERNGHQNNSRGEVNEGAQLPKGARNTKKGRAMIDFVDFQHYTPQSNSYHHRETRKYKYVSNFVKEDYAKVACKLLLRHDKWEELSIIDSSVNWEDVIQVMLTCEELPSCPICLCNPICPVSPVCGHPLCYSCALRFLDMCPGATCPICEKAIHLKDLKPLKTSTYQKIGIGDDISFRLVQRYKSGCVVFPVGEEFEMGCIPNISCDWAYTYCNVFTATPSQILQSVLLPQEEELKTQLCLLDETDIECEPYVLRALEILEGEKQACFEKMTLSAEAPLLSLTSYGENERKVFFYQSEDGQIIFLDPLNTRCLIHEYGSIESAPAEISCKIIAQECYTQSPDLRSRYRYYSHLPLGSSFILCEVDIEPHVSPEVYEKFRSDIEKRADFRTRKERKEKAYNNMIAEKEKEVVYHCSAYLPTYTEVTKHTAEHFKTVENYENLISVNEASDEPLSFAEKLRHGASKSTPWVRNVASAGSSGRERIDSSNSTCSEEINIHIPSFQSSFSASLNDAFSNFVVQEHQAAPSGKKKKNRKGKTISLTGGARRN